MESVLEQVTANGSAPHAVRATRTSPVMSYLERLHGRYAWLREGAVASYIPELAKADPGLFGIAIATCDGTVYEVGDSRVEFSIQSISKPLTYGIVLEDRGEEEVRARIGVEPSGEAFNSISLAPGTGTPLNPMINAGAIAASALVRPDGSGDRFNRVLSAYSRYAGRELSVDPAVHASESETGHRNRAIGHLLRNAGIVEDDPEQALQLYFQQCSVLVSCRDLAVIAATLANGGANPVTHERAAEEQTVRRILSVMTSCGMYDFAGEWLWAVGLPAKSGVSGGVMAVLPGQLGIGVFSPPLDARGNSVRGVRVCEDVSRDLGLHLVQSGRRPGPPIRSVRDLTRSGSKRVRSERESAVLERRGSRAAAYELQGEILFAAAEEVSRRLVEAGDSLDLAILDLRRVRKVDAAVVPIIAGLVSSFGARGARIALSGVARHSAFVDALARRVSGPLLTFPELDFALEWCERALLAGAGAEPDAGSVALADHELLRGLDESGRDLVAGFLRQRQFDAGSTAVRRGEPADELFLITAGSMSVMLDLPSGEQRRLATLSAGMVFGELALISRETRTADVRADTVVECYALSADDLDSLGEVDPRTKCILLENLLRIVGRVARRMTDELAEISAA